MFNYFYDLFNGFLGVDNVVIATCMAQMIAILFCICLIYLLTKIVFPKDSTVKKVVFCSLFIASMLVVLYANGINLVHITQALALSGGA